MHTSWKRFVAVIIALGFTSACGNDRSSPVSPTPLAAPLPLSAPALASSLAAPTIEVILPTSGPTTGGTEITISGTGVAEGATVNVGAWPALTVMVLSDTTVTATTSPHSEGTFDVTIINPDGQFGTLPSAFMYFADQPPLDLVVTITRSGVSPKELEVPIGSRVTFVNNDSRAHDIESDPHPFHTDCLAIGRVGFIRPGESKLTDVFEVEGVCGYHDHNQSTNRALQGTIVVIPLAVAGPPHGKSRL